MGGRGFHSAMRATASPDQDVTLRGEDQQTRRRNEMSSGLAANRLISRKHPRVRALLDVRRPRRNFDVVNVWRNLEKSSLEVERTRCRITGVAANRAS